MITLLPYLSVDCPETRREATYKVSASTVLSGFREVPLVNKSEYRRECSYREKTLNVNEILKLKGLRVIPNEVLTLYFK